MSRQPQQAPRLTRIATHGRFPCCLAALTTSASTKHCCQSDLPPVILSCVLPLNHCSSLSACRPVYEHSHSISSKGCAAQMRTPSSSPCKLAWQTSTQSWHLCGKSWARCRPLRLMQTQGLRSTTSRSSTCWITPRKCSRASISNGRKQQRLRGSLKKVHQPGLRLISERGSASWLW